MSNTIETTGTTLCPNRHPVRIGSAFCSDCGAPVSESLPTHTAKGSSTRNDGFAVASLVLGIVGLFIGLCSILALVFGYKARRRINTNPGLKQGRGRALAGIVLGWIGIAWMVVLCAVIVTAITTASNPGRLGNSGSGNTANSGIKHPGSGQTGNAGNNTPTGAVVSSPIFPVGVSCPSTTDCVAVGNGAAVTTNGGATWTEGASSAPGANMAVSCISASDCMTVGGGGDFGPVFYSYTTDGGASWSEGNLPRGLDPLESVSCSAPRDCVAVDNDGDVVSTANGGATWSEKRNANPEGAPVSCPSVDVCVGIGIFSTDGGVSWSRGKMPATWGSFAWNSVSCSSISDCVAVGSPDNPLHDGYEGVTIYTKNAGASWSWGTKEGIGGVQSVSCSAPGDCVAVGWNLNNQAKFVSLEAIYTTDDGISWSQGVLPKNSGIDELSDVSCSSTTDCMAVGVPYSPSNFGGAVFTTNGGATWSVASSL